MPKQVTYLILVCCLLAALTGCSPAQEPTTEATLPPEDTVEVEETVPTEPVSPPTATSGAEETSSEDEGDPPMEMMITSPSFNEGDPIPVQFSCDGDDLSPELVWSGIPEETASLALIMDDPDAPVGTWDHWILFNIPADSTGLSEGITGLGIDGNNSWNQTGYGGPCPPSGTHRYFFKLYALDSTLDLEVGATKETLELAMEGHILAQAELMGIFTR